MLKIRKKITAIRSAAKAGWIAAECQKKNIIFPCIIDDENERIIACHRHEDEIARLAKINEQAQ